MAAKEALKRAWITAHQIWSQTEAPSSPFHNRRRLKWLVLAGLSMLVFIIVLPVFPLDIGMPTLDISSVRTAPEVVGWHKPENLTIVALVFYGRRANVQLLERYLRANLVDNGGLLDRVHWISQVRQEPDAEYLETILQSNPVRYTSRDFGMMKEFGDYRGLWDHDIDPDTLYLKIDDDIVYIHDNTIPALVKRKLEHPEQLFVSANVVNHPRLQKHHNAFFATLPFAPEQAPLHPSSNIHHDAPSTPNHESNTNPEPHPPHHPDPPSGPFPPDPPDPPHHPEPPHQPESDAHYEPHQVESSPHHEPNIPRQVHPNHNPTSLPDWRISHLPSSPLTTLESMDLWPPPPPYKHRWLPMRGSTLDDCPIRNGMTCSSLPQWQCAAIAHYSFFQRLEEGQESLKLYDFGAWDIHGLAYDRWSINFFVAWGHEFIDARPIPRDDEQHLSSNYPRRVRKHCVALGSALASHLAYFWQAEVINSTDVLDRYKALAIEKFGNDLLLYDF